MTENGRLSGRQRKALAALVAGRRLAAVASAAGVSLRTLHRWRTSPDFQAALQAGQNEAFAESLEALRRTTSAAVAAVAALLRRSVAPEHRLSAARTVLSLALRTHDAVTLEGRIAALEARLAGRLE